MKEAVLVYPHQLFAEHPALAHGRTVYVLEDPLYFSQYRFHKQKLILHRASMKAYEAFLLDTGYSVRYIEHSVLSKNSLSAILKGDGVQVIHGAEVVDDWLEQRVLREAQSASVQVVWHPTPQFLTSSEDLRVYWNSKERHVQHSFYVWQRTRLNVLIDNGKPRGGKWSFDADNRKPLPKHISLPPAYPYTSSPFVDEARAYVETHFGTNYGTSDTFAYAVTHEEARKRLNLFLKERFASFGAYEDAMTERGHELFHSVLSPYLNNGLLTPEEVLHAALEYAQKERVPLASLEGFIRQLVGWREFIRMVYICDGRRMRGCNVLNAQRNLTQAWWEGTTGLAPIDAAIDTLKAHAYTHHIIRLMVVGNSMTLLGIHPDQAYRWFMEWYIDAYDWVMVPNVYGMALFSDGGSMVTKPYISSSRYILKMSDYPKGTWTRLWDGLYWAFVEQHTDVLSKNVRSKFSVSMLKRLAKGTRAEHSAAAQEAIAALTS